MSVETPQVPLQTHRSRPRGRGSLCVYEPSEGSDTYSGFRSSDSDHSSPLTVPSVTRSLSPLEMGTWLRVRARPPLGVLGESADLPLWHRAHVLQETLFSARLAAALRSGHWGSVRTPSPRSSPHSSWTAVTTRALLPPGPHSSTRPGLSLSFSCRGPAPNLRLPAPGDLVTSSWLPGSHALREAAAPGPEASQRPGAASQVRALNHPFAIFLFSCHFQRCPALGLRFGLLS